MSLSGFEPTVELHQTGTFRSLYRLGYNAAAKIVLLLQSLFHTIKEELDLYTGSLLL